MAKQLNPEQELANIQNNPGSLEHEAVLEQQSWLEKLAQQRDAILCMTPQLSAWFGEQFTARAYP